MAEKERQASLYSNQELLAETEASLGLEDFILTSKEKKALARFQRATPRGREIGRQALIARYEKA